jgi:hypothetical protein
MDTKTHLVQGYEYREYRGAGHPLTMMLNPEIGDLYIDITGPYSVWIYTGKSRGWVAWQSMKDTQLVRHPKQDRILFPNPSRFAWVPAKGITGYQRQAQFSLGDREDTAHSYVSIILEKEGIIVPNDISEGRLEATGSKEEDSDEGGSDDSPDEGESEKDDESESGSESESEETEKHDESDEEESGRHSVQGNDASHDSDELMVDNILLNTSPKDMVSSPGYNSDVEVDEDVSMEIDFDVRCSDMRSANTEIRQAVLKSSGMNCIHKHEDMTRKYFR